MNELCGTARNISYVRRDDDTWLALVEGIILVSEPVHRIDQAGTPFKKREVSQLRFGAHPEGLRKLAAAFLEWADEAEKDAPPAPERPKPNGPAGE
jgi:hypothetical protein